MTSKRNEWLSVKEAAETINTALGAGSITEGGIRWLCREKRITSKKPGRDWLVGSLGVQDYIKKHRS